MSVNLCEVCEEDGSYLVNYAVGDNQVLVIDIGAPVSLVGKKWVKRYMEENGLDKECMESQECEQLFKFGPSRKYVSKEMVRLPVMMRAIDRKVLKVWIMAYVVDADVPFLIGKKTLEEWKSRLDTQERELVVEMEGKKSKVKMEVTGSHHFGVRVEKWKEELGQRKKGRVK